MTGEKIRSLRKDNKPSKDEDLLEPDEEAATGTFTSSTRTISGKGKANKIFSNHKIIKSAATQQQHNQQTQLNANTNTTATSDTIDDKNKNPIIRAGQDFPVHECVFKGDVRRLSSLIRTQNIAQKDVHGKFQLCYNLPLEVSMRPELLEFVRFSAKLAVCCLIYGAITFCVCVYHFVSLIIHCER